MIKHRLLLAGLFLCGFALLADAQPLQRIGHTTLVPRQNTVTSTNASLLVSAWTVLGPCTEGSSGQFQFTDPQPAASPQRFCRIRSP
jgi:hypothetical protein